MGHSSLPRLLGGAGRFQRAHIARHLGGDLVFSNSQVVARLKVHPKNGWLSLNGKAGISFDTEALGTGLALVPHGVWREPATSIIQEREVRPMVGTMASGMRNLTGPHVLFHVV